MNVAYALLTEGAPEGSKERDKLDRELRALPGRQVNVGQGDLMRAFGMQGG